MTGLCPSSAATLVIRNIVKFVIFYLQYTIFMLTVPKLKKYYNFNIRTHFSFSLKQMPIILVLVLVLVRKVSLLSTIC